MTAGAYSSKEQSMNMNGGAATGLDALRRTVRRLERGTGRAAEAVLRTGYGPLDGLMPTGGLLRGRIHEILGVERTLEGAAFGFATALAACLQRDAADTGGQVLWVRQEAGPVRGAGLSGRGFAAFGLAPDRLLCVAARDAAELLWVAEEGLRTGGLAAVVAEVRTVDLTAGRRLQLAAEAGGVTGLLVATGYRDGTAMASAAETRWRVRPALSADPFRTPVWALALERSRGGLPAALTLGWSLADRCFVDAPAMAPGRRSADPSVHPAVDPAVDPAVRPSVTRAAQPDLFPDLSEELAA